MKPILTKELKQKILHYHNQKLSPEMMVKAKGVTARIGSTTILKNPWTTSRPEKTDYWLT